jgi:hypothetical protein
MSIIYSNSQEQKLVTDCHIRKVQYLLWNTLAQRQMCYLFTHIGPSFLLTPLEGAVNEWTPCAFPMEVCNSSSHQHNNLRLCNLCLVFWFFRHSTANINQLGTVSIRINCLEKPIFLFVYCQAPFLWPWQADTFYTLPILIVGNTWQTDCIMRQFMLSCLLHSTPPLSVS